MAGFGDSDIGDDWICFSFRWAQQQIRSERQIAATISQEKTMRCRMMDIDRAVAPVTGENIGVIRNFGFGIADPFEVSFDSEPRGPFMLDWDSMMPEWPGM
jgi:hypothetical protein